MARPSTTSERSQRDREHQPQAAVGHPLHGPGGRGLRAVRPGSGSGVVGRSPGAMPELLGGDGRSRPATTGLVRLGVRRAGSVGELLPRWACELVSPAMLSRSAADVQRDDAAEQHGQHDDPGRPRRAQPARPGAAAARRGTARGAWPARHRAGARGRAVPGAATLTAPASSRPRAAWPRRSAGSVAALVDGRHHRPAWSGCAGGLVPAHAHGEVRRAGAAAGRRRG